MKDFDIVKLFWSKSRAKILEKFFLEYASENDEPCHMRGLSREIDEQINSVKRELENLEALGILKSYTENKKKYFSLNKRFPLLEEFKSVFLKTYNPLDAISNYLTNKEGLDLAVVNSSLSERLYSTTNNIVDVFLIWNIDKEEFNNNLAKIFFNRKIKYAVISKEDFFNRIDYNDKLIFDILRQENNVILRDELWLQNYMK